MNVTTHATADQRSGPTNPERAKRFAIYFKNYMGLSTIVTAALPIPVTAFDLIPMFEAQRKVFAVYTSLFCFLALAYVFYVRQILAHLMFRRRFFYALIPLVMIIGAVACMWFYHTILVDSVARAAPTGVAPADVLARAPLSFIPRSGTLMLSYIGMFFFAELAFVIMATREYMQDVLGVTDQALFDGGARKDEG